jgi:hypothetical protein
MNNLSEMDELTKQDRDGNSVTNTGEGETELVEQGEKTLNDVTKERKWTFFTALFVIGLFNNNGYVMVAAGA